MASSAPGSIETVGKFDIFADEKHRLGMGSTGIVYSGVDRLTNTMVAGKKVSILTDYFTAGQFEREADLLRNKITPHENIIKVHDFTKIEYEEDGTNMMDLWLIMEYCERGNLKKFARQRDLSILDKLHLMEQSSHGVLHLHQCSVAHRDIKPENILITGTEDRPVVRLCDFGSANSVKHNLEGRSMTMTSLAGTPNYMAPEQLEPVNQAKFAYSNAVDVYSLGLVCLALIEISKGSTMKAKMVNGQSLGRTMWLIQMRCAHLMADFRVTPELCIDAQSDSPLESAVKQIIKQMIQFHPQDRPSMAQVVAQLAAVRDQHTTAVIATPVRITPPEAANGASSAPTPSSTPSPASAPPASTVGRRSAAVRPKQIIPSHHARTVTSKGTAAKSTVRGGRSAPSAHKTRPPRAGGLTPAVPTSARLLTTHQPQYAVDLTPGLGYHGEVILADFESLHKLLHTGHDYAEVWAKTLPDHLQDCFHKAVSSDGDIFLQDNDRTDVTICFTESLDEKYRLHQQGMLLDSCDGDLFYGQGSRGERDWSVIVRTDHDGGSNTPVEPVAPSSLGRPLTLQPPVGTDGWGDRLSVCRVQERYLVVESVSRNLDVFDARGAHITRKHLDYEPSIFHAITATTGHHNILVAESSPPRVHVYSRQCKELARIGHEQLQLEEDAWLQGVRCSSGGDGLLHACTGDCADMTALHVYKLESK